MSLGLANLLLCMVHVHCSRLWTWLQLLLARKQPLTAPTDPAESLVCTPLTWLPTPCTAYMMPPLLYCSQAGIAPGPRWPAHKKAPRPPQGQQEQENSVEAGRRGDTRHCGLCREAGLLDLHRPAALFKWQPAPAPRGGVSGRGTCLHTKSIWAACGTDGQPLKLCLASLVAGGS